MTRDTLERSQVWLYLAAILLGLGLGAATPAVGPVLERLLWPALALLLYATFTQTPLGRLPAAFRDRRFMAALTLGNFVLLPLLVWGLLALTPADPAIRLGVLLVLLAPCTDWFVAFAHQGGGDAGQAIAATPALLLLQMLLLPVYLWLFMGEGFGEIVSAGRMVPVFVGLIVVPLLLAGLTQFWVRETPSRARVTARLGWLPVPLLAVVLFMVAGSQVEAVRGALPLLGEVFPAFVLFLVGAVVLGMALGRLFRLPVAQARTLLFSFATRNSFVVLPFALALPAAWQAAAVVIVFQSLIELLGLLALLWLVPRRLIR